MLIGILGVIAVLVVSLLLGVALAHAYTPDESQYNVELLAKFKK